MLKEARFSLTLDPAVHEGLRAIAEDRQTHVAEVVRSVLTELVEREVWSRTIGGTVLAGLKRGLSNEAVAEEVLAAHPGSAINPTTVSWYRTKARKEDPSIPRDREARAKASGG
jgi:hypothetical protein